MEYFIELSSDRQVAKSWSKCVGPFDKSTQPKTGQSTFPRLKIPFYCMENK